LEHYCACPGSWPSVYKIDDTRLVIGNSCLDVESGRILWTSDVFSANPSAFFVANVYSPEEKMFYVKTGSFVQGWDFSDPSTPPTKAWETYVSGGGLVGSGVQYGDGKVFPGSYDPHQVALDARTGRVVWDTETKTPMVFSGSYYQGKFFREAPMTTLCIASMLTLAKFFGLSTLEPKMATSALVPPLLMEWCTSSTKMGISMLLT